jgi:hypothetical protein
MKGLLRIFILVVVLVVVVGAALAMLADSPPPTQHIEKVIPNGQLGH